MEQSNTSSIVITSLDQSTSASLPPNPTSAHVDITSSDPIPAEPGGFVPVLDEPSLTNPSVQASADAPTSDTHVSSSRQSPNEDDSKSSVDTSPKTDVRRVKVYELKGDTWLDRGTGHCIGVFEPHPALLPTSESSEPEPSTSKAISPNHSNEPDARLEVREEANEGSPGGQLLLRSQILRPNLTGFDGWKKSKRSQQSSSSPNSSSSSSDEDDDDLDDDLQDDDDDDDPDDASHRPKRSSGRASTALRPPGWPEGGGIYQRQQATLVVWTEPDGTDMALSFATAQGCQEIWAFLCDVQNYLGPTPSANVDQASLDSAIRSKGYGHQAGHSRKDSINWDDEDLNDGTSQDSGEGPHSQNGALGEDDDHLSISMDIFGHSANGLNSHASSHSALMTTLPEPTLSNIHEIECMIKWACRSSYARERVSSNILRRDYVKQLQQVKLEAEDLESLKDLHALCTLVHSILMLNDAAIYEYCLQDDIVLIVAGILDYDPEFGNQKASYYSDLSDQSRFKQVVPIRDPSITAKIHQTYRLQYFKDIILARILDDSTFSIINSMIFFNQIDIVQYLHSNDAFMRELFGIFHDPPLVRTASSPVIGPSLPPSMIENATPSNLTDSQSIDRKIDSILFIQQLCAMAKHLQPPSRIGFFRSLAERGVLKVIEFGLSKKPGPINQVPQLSAIECDDPLNDSAIKSAVCEILITIIDYDPNSVRGYCLKQHRQKTRNLVECLIDLLLVEADLGLKVQLVEALRILVDTGAGIGGMPGGGFDGSARMDEDPENEFFLQFFYDHCINHLAQPLYQMPEHKNAKQSDLMINGVQAAMYNHLCDLFCFFITHHSFRSKYVVLSSNLPAKVATLLSLDRYKFVQLSALRFFRACLNKQDEFYNRCFVKHDLFVPVIELLVRQGSKDNLCSSACLEFFENIRLTNPKAILNHVMDRDGPRIRGLAERLVTFTNLVIKWEQNNEPPPPPAAANASSSNTLGSSSATIENIDTDVRNIGSWSRTGTLDAEEENYFNHDSDEEETEEPKIASTSGNPSGPNPIVIPTIPSALGKAPAACAGGAGRKRSRSGVLLAEGTRRGLVRSQTHSGPFLSTPPEDSSQLTPQPLVDYADEEEEEGPERAEPSDPASGPSELRAASEPPKRRRRSEEEEEEDGAFGRLKRERSSPMIRSGGLSFGSTRKVSSESPKIVLSLGSVSGTGSNVGSTGVGEASGGG